MQEIIMSLIVNAGQARSCAMQAIAEAKRKDFIEAAKTIDDSEEFLNIAHNSQTRLLSKEANNEGIDISLLLIHAQDHLMNAITVKDLAKEFIDVYLDKEE